MPGTATGTGTEGGNLVGCQGLPGRVQVAGAYERVGDRVHVTAQVVDVATGAVAHRARLDGAVGDLFALQDRLVSTLADGLVAMGGPTAASVTGSLAFDRGEAAAAPAAPTSRQPGARPGTGLGGFTIGGRPRAVAARTNQPPRIDGRLDDAVWLAVEPITDFVQTSPVEGAPATERTEVWIAYDRDHLYIAFYAHYSDPGIIRANRAERDQSMGDDRMAVLFDPFLDQQRAYQFSVNGYGVPGDSIVNAGGSASRSRSSVGRSSGGGGGGGGAAGVAEAEAAGASRPGSASAATAPGTRCSRRAAASSRTAGRPRWPYRSRASATRRSPRAGCTAGASRSAATSARSPSRWSGRPSRATSPAS